MYFKILHIPAVLIVTWTGLLTLLEIRNHERARDSLRLLEMLVLGQRQCAAQWHLRCLPTWASVCLSCTFLPALDLNTNPPLSCLPSLSVGSSSCSNCSRTPLPLPPPTQTAPPLLHPPPLITIAERRGKRRRTKRRKTKRRARGSESTSPKLMTPPIQTEGMLIRELEYYVFCT